MARSSAHRSSAATLTSAGSSAAMNPAQTRTIGVVNLLGAYNTGSIATFWYSTMAAWGRSYAKPTLYTYDQSIYACGGWQAPSNSFYCPGTNAIYTGVSWNQQQLNAYGDNAPGGILAHEWGHAIDRWIGYPDRTFRSEYFADCLAGMYARYGYAAGRLTGSDYGEMWNWLANRTSSSTHGIGANRAAWYRYGYVNYSLGACQQAFSVSGARTLPTEGVIGTSPGEKSVRVTTIPSVPATSALQRTRTGVVLPKLTAPLVGAVPAVTAR